VRAGVGYRLTLADAAPLSPPLAGEAARLEDARLAVTEERITCDLALGRHGEVAGELTGLAARSRRPASRADSAGNPR
jgi:hypothetical protein